MDSHGMDHWTMAFAKDIKLKPDLANFTFEGSEVICAMAGLAATGPALGKWLVILYIVLDDRILDHLYLAESSYLF